MSKKGSWFIYRIDKDGANGPLTFLSPGSLSATAGGLGWTTNYKKAFYFDTKTLAKMAIRQWDELWLFKDILAVGKELSL